MNEDYLTILKYEFHAEEGSFLLQLRVNLRWDKVAFDRLTKAMFMCCKHFQEEYMQAQETMLPRWLAEGFWYLSYFVKEWTSHSSWEEKIAREPDYFKKAYERLFQLAFWFFEGIPPWNDVEKGWASTFI